MLPVSKINPSRHQSSVSISLSYVEIPLHKISIHYVLNKNDYQFSLVVVLISLCISCYCSGSCCLSNSGLVAVLHSSLSWISHFYSCNCPNTRTLSAFVFLFLFQYLLTHTNQNSNVVNLSCCIPPDGCKPILKKSTDVGKTL